MGIRESLNQKPALAYALVGLVLAIAAACLVFSLRSSQPGPQTMAFYSTDDGNTFFADSLDRITPFEHEGKQAVLARVFTCDAGKTKFVGYLERHTADIRKRLESSDADVKAGKPKSLDRNSMEVTIYGSEIKKRGESKWVQSKDAAARAAVMSVPCPAGGELDSVVP